MIPTNTSKLQLGAVINQNHKLIAFYIRKLNLAQPNYTTTVRELLLVIDTLLQKYTIRTTN